MTDDDARDATLELFARQGITIASAADCARHRHGLACYCASCGRWADLNLGCSFGGAAKLQSLLSALW